MTLSLYDVTCFLCNFFKKRIDGVDDFDFELKNRSTDEFFGHLTEIELGCDISYVMKNDRLWSFLW